MTRITRNFEYCIHKRNLIIYFILLLSPVPISSCRVWYKISTFYSFVLFFPLFNVFVSTPLHIPSIGGSLLYSVVLFICFWSCVPQHYTFSVVGKWLGNTAVSSEFPSRQAWAHEICPESLCRLLDFCSSQYAWIHSASLFLLDQSLAPG